ncbi:alpha/beta hydrolase [Bacillus luteolus]|uniref:Alpha/beta hydrolase n=1 Tax=Litchfieldia luteola TaxID=682179 RepID=A0ABR9QKC7_9BACI|nr:alpha/beta hydrolase [Cytobacillus luteolus]MBE4908953.1 alpha/beta hydrolase [Cytobacillus luteolus]MBP1941812.1 acetyl esterase [Cytobacillus luteolus]
MNLDPQAKMLLDMMAASGAPAIETLSPEQAREAFALTQQRLRQGASEIVVHKIEDMTINGEKDDIKIRVYSPKDNEILPALIYFHGGGWVLGNLESHDSLCRAIANSAECVVISVDYSLAPEHKFPVAVYDAFHATKWVYDNAEALKVDPARLAVGGDSAGGNLAAAVTHLAKKDGFLKLCFQALLYPSTNFGITESYSLFSEGYFLTKSAMSWFRDCYLNGTEDLTNPLAAPLLIDDKSDLPPALIITAGFDPLRDEGKAYAESLTEAGIEVEYKCYDGMIHGFISMFGVLHQGKLAVEHISNSLQNAFNKTTVKEV